MVRLFQVQLEHYEKVEGVALSLEGKANQLAQMVRTNLGMAMQGFVVVPLFCGYDVARGEGRIFDYDAAGRSLRGGRLPDDRARAAPTRETTIRLGYRDAMPLDDAVELAILSLYEAADADSATGGPDAVRGIYPVVATVTAQGYAQLADDDVAARFDAIIERRRAAHGQRGGHAAMTMPYYVAPEQVMKDRAEYAQKGIARGRALVRDASTTTASLLVAENPSSTLHKISEIYDRIAFAGRRQVQRVRPAPRRGRPPRRHEGLRLQPRGRRRAVACEPLRPVPRQRLHPRDEAAGGRDPRRRARRRPRRAAAVPHRLRGHDHRRGRLRGPRRRRRGDPRRGSPTARAHGLDAAGGAAPRRRRARGPGPHPRRRRISRSRCSPTSAHRRTFRRLEDDEVASLLAD